MIEDAQTRDNKNSLLERQKAAEKMRWSQFARLRTAMFFSSTLISANSLRN